MIVLLMKNYTGIFDTIADIDFLCGNSDFYVKRVLTIKEGQQMIWINYSQERLFLFGIEYAGDICYHKLYKLPYSCCHGGFVESEHREHEII